MTQQAILAAVWLQGQPAAIERLTPQTKARVLAALAAFIILALLLVALAWMGARATRRYMRIGSKLGETAGARATRLDEDAWCRKPLSPKLESPNPIDTDAQP